MKKLLVLASLCTILSTSVFADAVVSAVGVTVGLGTTVTGLSYSLEEALDKQHAKEIANEFAKYELTNEFSPQMEQLLMNISEESSLTLDEAIDALAEKVDQAL
jgi:pyruvoyl-dependent arginine decarboxylase (PvlArgDC)